MAFAYMAISYLSVLAVLFAAFLNMVKPKKNIILGVTIPRDAHNDESLMGIAAGFKLRLSIACTFLFGALLLGMLAGTYGEMFLYVNVWVILAMNALFLVYAHSHIMLKSLKMRKGWNSVSANQVFVDTIAASQPRKSTNLFWFLAPLAISAIPSAALWIEGDSDFFIHLIMYGSFSTIIAVLMAIESLLKRQPSDAIDASTERTLALTRMRCRYWSIVWVSSAWLTALFSICMWLSGQRALWLIIASTGYSLAEIAIFLWGEFRTRGEQGRLSAQRDGEHFLDDDSLWFLGVLYNNPNDRHVMRSRRVGMGMTMNIAKPGVRILHVFAVLLLLMIPVFGAIPLYEERAAIQLSVSDSALIATHGMSKCEVPLIDIASIGWLDALPDAERIAGTGLESVLKGRFDVQGYGGSTLMLDPRSPVIEVSANDGERYFFGFSNSDETLAIYKALTDALDG
jgi:uncharacterized membrane protein